MQPPGQVDGTDCPGVSFRLRQDCEEDARAFVTQYLIPRLIQCFLVIFLGVTAVFVIPRLTPTDPVLRTITSLRAQGSSLDSATVERMIEDLREHYGLQGSMLQQYGALWKRLFSADFLLTFSSLHRLLNTIRGPSKEVYGLQIANLGTHPGGGPDG